MTRAEARNKMNLGFKVTHLYFGSDEYLYMDEQGNILCEKGYNMNEWFNIIWPSEEWKVTNWRIYQEKAQ